MRSLLTAAAISLAFTLFLTPVFLRLFRKWGWGQVIRTPDDVHNPSHGEKRGTPTMGGTIFIVGTISLAAGVTYAIVRISPTKRREKGSAAKPAA